MTQHEDHPMPDALPPASADGAVRRLGRQGRSLTDELVAALTAQVRSRRFAPGDKLPSESELMQSYGVSRSVVRETLSRLQAAGLVQTQHGVGTFALDPAVAGALRLERTAATDLPDLLAMFEVRTSIEADAAGLAAARRTEAHLAAMRSALDDFARHVADAAGTVSPDFRFHHAIALATGNRYYDDLVSQLGLAVIPRTRYASAQLDEGQRIRHLQKVNDEHGEIYAAIARSDADAARAAMRMHLANSRERQRRAHGDPVG